MAYANWIKKVGMIIRSETAEQKDVRHFPCHYVSYFNLGFSPEKVAKIAMR